jgi:carboxymethylenebutenolidase
MCSNQTLMAHRKIELTTQEGRCPAYVFEPAGEGPFPGVLFFMDGIGIRPALFEMGERLAKAGHHVLLPDLFYRAGPYEPMDAKTVFSDPEKRKVLMGKYISVTTVEVVMRDVPALLTYFRGQPGVKQGKLGATGYCFGGRMALCAAGHHPDAFAAVASFHGGNLAVTDSADSPHLLAQKIKAEIYVAGAIQDSSFSDEQKERLEAALSSAGVKHVVETYPARHGWVPSDTPAHDPACAERHWTSLVDLFRRTLG